MSVKENNCSRVLFISPQPFFIERGSPLRVRATLLSLSKLGYSVDLLALPFGEDLNIKGVNVFRTFSLPGVKDIGIGPSWRKFVFDVLLLFYASFLMWKKSYTVIHGIEEGGIIAALLGKLTRTPYIFDMHSCMSDQVQEREYCEWSFLVKLLMYIERLCIRSASAVMTVCDDLTERSKAIAPNVPAFTVNDVSLDYFSKPSEKEVQALKDSFGLGNSRVIVYTGNFESYQGMELLLESFAVAKRARELRDTVLLLVGGDSENNRRRIELEMFAKSLDIGNSVVFAGVRPTSEMGAFMALGDALISSRTLGVNTPLKVYSYMASGKPIIATRIKSHTQVLTEDSCFLCEANPDDLARCIILALSDSEEAKLDREKKVAVAQKLAEERYSIKQFTENIKELYAAADSRHIPT